MSQIITQVHHFPNFGQNFRLRIERSRSTITGFYVEVIFYKSNVFVWLFFVILCFVPEELHNLGHAFQMLFRILHFGVTIVSYSPLMIISGFRSWPEEFMMKSIFLNLSVGKALLQLIQNWIYYVLIISHLDNVLIAAIKLFTYLLQTRINILQINLDFVLHLAVFLDGVFALA